MYGSYCIIARKTNVEERQDKIKRIEGRKKSKAIL
jgi:hypothetical protein